MNFHINQIKQDTVLHIFARQRAGVFLAICSLGFIAPASAEFPKVGCNQENARDIFLQAQWESRYVTEGRDNLDGASIQTSTINIECGDLGLLVWNGWGYDSGYDELNIMPSISYEFYDIDFSLSYNYKKFFEEDVSDHEIGSSVYVNALPYNFYTGIDWYYSFDANGSFIEFVLGSSIQAAEKTSLEPVFIFGINDNYIDDGHDGANHISLQLNGKHEITEQLYLNGFLRYNLAIDSDHITHAGDELLKNFFWGGIGLQLNF